MCADMCRHLLRIDVCGDMCGDMCAQRFASTGGNEFFHVNDVCIHGCSHVRRRECRKVCRQAFGHVAGTVRFPWHWAKWSVEASMECSMTECLMERSMECSTDRSMMSHPTMAAIAAVDGQVGRGPQDADELCGDILVIMACWPNRISYKMAAVYSGMGATCADILCH